MDAIVSVHDDSNLVPRENRKRAAVDIEESNSSEKLENAIRLDEIMPRIGEGCDLLSSSIPVTLSSAQERFFVQGTLTENPALSTSYVQPSIPPVTRGRPKGGGKDSAWIPLSERVGAVLPLPVYNSVKVPKKPRPVIRKSSVSSTGADGSIPALDATDSAARSGNSSSSMNVASGGGGAGTKRGRPKGISGGSTWITPALRSAEDYK